MTVLDGDLLEGELINLLTLTAKKAHCQNSSKILKEEKSKSKYQFIHYFYKNIVDNST